MSITKTVIIQKSESIIKQKKNRLRLKLSYSYIFMYDLKCQRILLTHMSSSNYFANLMAPKYAPAKVNRFLFFVYVGILVSW